MSTSDFPHGTGVAMKSIFRGLAAFVAIIASAATWAGTSLATLNVNIALARNSGLCVSETLSAATGATVRVVCQTGQFVDISPVPGRPFAGVHGGAYRFHLGVGTARGQPGDGLDPFVGVGTVTALRVYYADGTDGPLEMLVSF